MLAHVVTGFEMLRGKLQRIGATLGAAAVLSACSGAVEEPAVAELEDIDAMTEEDTEPPADVDGEDAEVDGDEQAADDPDEGTEPADDVTETAEGDPYAIPEDGIDEEYVERVLNAIFEVNREALAITLESEPGGLAPFEAEERLRAIYGGTYGAASLYGYNEIASSTDQRELFLENPGPVSSRVKQVLLAQTECLVAEHSLDFTAVLREPGQPRTEFVALARLSPEARASTLNPTPWMVVAADSGSAEGLECE
jgi:hypothetical protein